MAPPRIVGFGGAQRPGSSSDRIVAAVLRACEAHGATTQQFTGSDLAALPLYDPTDPERTARQKAFVEAIGAASGVVIGTPSYHGGVSGLVKNAIDLLQDLAEGPLVYLDQRPVGLVVCAAGWQAAGTTLSSLRDIVQALRGWPTPFGVSANTVAQTCFDPASGALAPRLAADVERQAQQIMESVLSRRAYRNALSNRDSFWPNPLVDRVGEALDLARES